MLDDAVHEQLNSAETDLLSALRGEKDLAVYHSEWTKLLDTVSVSSAAGRLDTSTTALAQKVAMRIACIAECFVDIEREYHNLSDGLHDRWRSALANYFADESGVSHSQDAPCADSTSLRHPNYFAPAYRWLLANLHNPYPTVEVKERIALLAGCSAASINSWFINVRRRIGWTAICREHFRNCRADTVDAACRVFVSEDPSQPVSPEVTQAFLEMKTTAKGLFSSTSDESPFFPDFDQLVKDMIETDSPHSPDSSKEPNIPVRQTGNSIPLDRPSSSSCQRTSYGPATYPPRHSLPPSPVPTVESSFSSESDDEAVVSPPIVAGQKRNIVLSDGPGLAYETACAHKRRSVMSECNAEDFSCNTVPLGKPLGDELLIDSLQVSSQVTSTPQHPRKRRLSDADGQFYRKRPQGLPRGPRVHAVSDPLPKSTAIESSINDWFNTNFPDIFDIPSPVGVDELDPSALWQVELFNDYQIPGAPPGKSQGVVPHYSTHAQTGSALVPGTFWPSACISQTSLDAVSEPPEFSNFLQFLDDRVYDRTFPTLDANAPPTTLPLSHIDLSPLAVCSELSHPAEPCDFLGSALNQPFVAIGDYSNDGVNLSTIQKRTTCADNFFGPLQPPSAVSSHLNPMSEGQHYRQLLSLCI